MFNGQERRKYKRIEDLPIENPIMAGFQIRSDEVQEIESEDWYSITFMNISAGGAFFYYTKDLGIDTLLDLKIGVPKSMPTLNCVGEIIRSDKFEPFSVFRTAIKFIDIGEREKELINKMTEGISE